MIARLALTFCLILAASSAPAATALPNNLASAARLDCELRRSSATVSDVVIRNRNSAIPPQTYFEVRSDTGASIAVVAPNGIGAGGHLNIRKAKIAGESCTVKIVLVSAP